MEEVLISHSSIVEAAVVSKLDDLKGEIPVGFVVLYPGQSPDPVELEKELVQMMRKDIGAICCFKQCMILGALPKTRSGKILRGTIKSITNKQAYKTPSTIEDLAALDEIAKAVEEWEKTL